MRIVTTGIPYKREVITLVENATWPDDLPEDSCLPIPAAAVGRIKFLEISAKVTGTGLLQGLVYYQLQVAPDTWLTTKFFCLNLRPEVHHVYAIEPHAVPARLFIELSNGTYKLLNTTVRLLM